MSLGPMGLGVMDLWHDLGVRALYAMDLLEVEFLEVDLLEADLLEADLLEVGQLAMDLGLYSEIWI
jgi:hypothetical protein